MSLKQRYDSNTPSHICINIYLWIWPISWLICHMHPYAQQQVLELEHYCDHSEHSKPYMECIDNSNSKTQLEWIKKCHVNFDKPPMLQTWLHDFLSSLRLQQFLKTYTSSNGQSFQLHPVRGFDIEPIEGWYWMLQTLNLFESKHMQLYI